MAEFRLHLPNQHFLSENLNKNKGYVNNKHDKHHVRSIMKNKNKVEDKHHFTPIMKIKCEGQKPNNINNDNQKA
jgi:hypothetical protein